MDTSIQYRRRYSDNYRRQIVAETWHGSESVSEVARRHDLNANLVFTWRPRYPQLSASIDPASPALIPIHVTPSAAESGERASAAVAPGRIALTLGGGHRLSLEGTLDPALVRMVLESLR